jgi:two-component system, chemotaxis family, protein-glutamate methylesterase/glutaminase
VNRSEPQVRAMTIDAIVIGGSAGSVPVLLDVLPALSAAIIAPIIVVVHLPPEPSRLARLLALACKRPVYEVEDKMPIEPSVIYIAPPSYHTLVERTRELALSVDDPVHYSRPSIDVLFDSAVDAFGGHLLGVVLSGANDDGAAGLARIERVGGIAIVQDPATATATAMPDAALAATKHRARIATPAGLPVLLHAVCTAKESQ